MRYLEAEDRAETFVPHAFDEHIVDLGEVRLNYSTTGDPSKPALLLIPGQSESWWGYEDVMPLLAKDFHVFAVDLRGQGRSTWTPGRYTVDNLGNDLVRFIDLVIGRPTYVSGLSSGGVLSAWLAAYAEPGQIRAAVFEDPPLFASEARTTCGQPINQGLGPAFAWWNKWLGDQWSIGDWKGLQNAAPRELPAPVLRALAVMMPRPEGADPDAGPPQNLKEYDPEWGRAFVSGSATASCDQATMLANVKVPVLLTHHFHQRDDESGMELGALSDLQVSRARELITGAGQSFDYRSFPDMPHSMHGHAPELFARTVTEWIGSLSGATTDRA
ncbi:alpha/beta hydrolase family protein [Nocardia nova SH22a]|uniref:Alpha/beta hydrolase family protein n=1 Tax=Nocardia nova SH22a TaxID=1415166 RepID=W5TK87_9NOCA|nr:alpha/beta hydrolase [Nocardia nova]AHH19780.1 alpha/beta hydrolase family protein [Nocardia nova SH22a]